MDKSTFLEFLHKYEIPSENMYEDISEIGIVLWHEHRIAVKFVWEPAKKPCLVIVILCPCGIYSYFECGVAEFDKSNIQEICRYAAQKENALYELALVSGDSMNIAIGEDSWLFRKA